MKITDKLLDAGLRFRCRDMEFEVHDARSRPAAPRYVDSTWEDHLEVGPREGGVRSKLVTQGGESPGLVRGRERIERHVQSVSVTRRCPLPCRIARESTSPVASPGEGGGAARAAASAR
jgi:hypothetical protein